MLLLASQMELHIIQKILKIVAITLMIFGILWIALIILYPDVRLLRDIPFGGLSLLLALIVFPIYLRLR